MSLLGKIFARRTSSRQLEKEYTQRGIPFPSAVLDVNPPNEDMVRSSITESVGTYLIRYKVEGPYLRVEVRKYKWQDPLLEVYFEVFNRRLIEVFKQARNTMLTWACSPIKLEELGPFTFTSIRLNKNHILWVPYRGSV